MAKHVLVVDDDKSLTDFLGDYLSGHGYEASVAHDGPSMRQAMTGRRVDLIVLDLNLPGESGFDLARELRTQSRVPIIMLTGRSDETDRVVGLEIGADDYVAKPFSVRELVARIGAVLRRAGEVTPPPPPPSVTPASASNRVGLFDGWRMDFATGRIFAPSGSEVRLTAGEFRLLSVFVTHANRILSRDQLIDLSRNAASEVFDRSIDIQVMRLRRKIEANPVRPMLLQTVRGLGYIFTPIIDWQ